MQWQCNCKCYNIIKVNGEWEWEHRNEMNVCTGSGSLSLALCALCAMLFLFSNHIRDEERTGEVKKESIWQNERERALARPNEANKNIKFILYRWNIWAGMAWHRIAWNGWPLCALLWIWYDVCWMNRLSKSLSNRTKCLVVAIYLFTIFQKLLFERIFGLFLMLLLAWICNLHHLFSHGDSKEPALFLRFILSFIFIDYHFELANDKYLTKYTANERIVKESFIFSPISNWPKPQTTTKQMQLNVKRWTIIHEIDTFPHVNRRRHEAWPIFMDNHCNLQWKCNDVEKKTKRDRKQQQNNTKLKTNATDLTLRFRPVWSSSVHSQSIRFGHLLKFHWFFHLDFYRFSKAETTEWREKNL